jgi:RNA-directed DNA polymerase
MLDSGNVKRAWKNVKRNHGAPGVDGKTIEEFPTYAREHWQDIRRALEEGTYQPSPVRRVEIPKPNGGIRLLGVPAITDRVIEQAIAQVLTPIFDPDFSESSFGFRPGRSAHQAVRQVRKYIDDGYTVAVEVDLSKFFDEVDHDVLMHRVSKKVRDKRLLRLIGKYLRAGVMVNGVIEPTRKGVPQGGPLSPVLSNIVLDDLDKELEKRGHKFARYADDFVILVKSERAGLRVKASITRFLEKKLKLKVNQEKSKVGPAKRCQFLGFTFPGRKIHWSDKAWQKFKAELKRLTGRSNGMSFTQRIEKLNRYIRGWMNYFGISQFWKPVEHIDDWLRRRLRMCKWKQWRKVKTRIRNLKKLGGVLSHAIRTAMSRKGPWRLSKTLATHSGMTNRRFHQTLKLVSIRDLWVQIHYPS